jgi:SAM-dependent methyltransferase
MVRHCFYAELPGAGLVTPDPIDGREFSHFTASLSELALRPGSVDGFVLHYGLEGVADPRRALREVARVLSYGGRLVLCAVNPVSLWGLRGLYSRFRGDMMSDLRFISPLRMLDWLAVLGLEVDQKIHYLGYGQPYGKSPGTSAFAQRLKEHQLPIGGVYVLTAVKTAHGVRPLRDRRRAARGKLAPVAYPRVGGYNRNKRGS